MTICEKSFLMQRVLERKLSPTYYTADVFMNLHDILRAVLYKVVFYIVTLLNYVKIKNK